MLLLISHSNCIVLWFLIKKIIVRATCTMLYVINYFCKLLQRLITGYWLSKTHMQDYYELIGCDRDATLFEIKKAYSRKVRELHPDKGGVDLSLLGSLREAWIVLK